MTDAFAIEGSGMKFHPIRFAVFCWCAKCETLVDRVETEHPNGLDKGPWDVIVFCHGQRHVMHLPHEIVRGIVDGTSRPVPTVFFEKSTVELHRLLADPNDPKAVQRHQPRVLSADEIIAIERGQRIFDLTVEEREGLARYAARGTKQIGVRS